MKRKSASQQKGVFLTGKMKRTGTLFLALLLFLLACQKIHDHLPGNRANAEVIYTGTTAGSFYITTTRCGCKTGKN